MRVVVLTTFLVAVLGATACSSGGEEAVPTPVPPLVELGILEITDGTTNWNRPIASVVTDEGIWVVDGGRDRIIHLDPEGKLLGVLCERDDCQFVLKSPLGLDMYGDRLYVANNEAGTVVVLTLDGRVDQTIELPAGASGPATPADVEIAPEGDFYVSDPANNRILHFDAAGEVIGGIETTDPDDPKYRLLRPLGLALDSSGDLYVADAADGRVKRYSPQGRFLEEYLMLGNPNFSTPQDVAVGRDGTVYFSDPKRSIVHAFSPAGEVLGIVGLAEASRIDSPGLLKSPYGLFIKDDKLYVTDLDGALFAFRIDPQYWAARAAR